MTDDKIDKVINIIHDAGGKIVGNHRVQKTAYFLKVAGFDDGFFFKRKPMGPHCEDIDEALYVGSLFKQIKSEERLADWGGYYNIYSAHNPSRAGIPINRIQVASKAANMNVINLCMASVAVSAYLDGNRDPWGEVVNRHPDLMVEGRLQEAKEFMDGLRAIECPHAIPVF